MDSTAFQPANLAGIQLKNRILRSATHEGMADENGFPLATLKKLYIRLAKGGAGAIITGYSGIQPDGKSPLFRMTMIDRDDVIPFYKDITDAVHEFNTPVIMQIAHAGRQTRTKITGLPTYAPSAVRDKFYSEDMPRELDETKINSLINHFVAAIVRAHKSGFDAVQLHGAHGYMLSQFLSSHSNLRTDAWGGTTRKKFRIIKEIVKQAKDILPDFPILIKISAHDSQKNGIRVKEAVEIAKLIEESGCSGIEVSCGVFEDGLYTMRGKKLPADAAMEYTFKYKTLPGFVKTIAKPVLNLMIKQPKPLLKFNLDAAIQIKKAVSIPVIIVGGINNTDDIHQIIDKEKIDFVSMSRPFIIQPDIVNKFIQGQQDRSKCIMCNYCSIIGEEKPLKCYYGKLPMSD
ncbi:MAG: NADH:flavin oxidoreductase [Deltaproteobacteria bacterium]|nr:NADH:flavin oxidoreductase [Deltaproteobacteria bacterium]